MNLLIISFGFEPYHKIGARRWAKFGEKLIERGHQVHVFTEDLRKQNGVSKKLNPGWHVNYFDSGYPRSQIFVRKGRLAKLHFKLNAAWLKKRVEGNFYDNSGLWAELLKKHLSDYCHKHSIEGIIVNGAPYHYFVHTLRLRASLPKGIKIAIDYRDPWNTGGTHAHYIGLQSPKRQKEEAALEVESLTLADHVFAASEDLRKSIQNFPSHATIPNLKNKLSTLLNGMDLTEGLSTLSDDKFLEKKKDKTTIRMMYFGGIHCGESTLARFVEALQRVQKEHENWSITVDCFGNIHKKYRDLFQELGESTIHFHKGISKNEFLEKSKGYDFMLYFKPFDYMQNSFGVKFFDYIRTKRLILLMSPDGIVKDCVESDGIGVVLDYDAPYRALKASIKARVGANLVSRYGMPEIMKHSLEHQIEHIEKVMGSRS